MTTTIKITELTNIGANLASSTVLPVVNMSGTPTTQKTILGNIANLVLAGAGGNYVAAAKATTANTVTTNAQPNITSTGTLTSLTVSGTTNLGAVANVIITGGSTGQVLTTDGAGNLSWTTSGGSGSYGNSDVANYLPTFTGNVGANWILANYISGNASSLTSITGANVTGAVQYAGTANSVAIANVSGIGNIATLSLTGSSSNVLYGNGVFAPASGGGSTGNITFSNTTISTAQTVDNVTIQTYDTANSIINNWKFDSAGNLSVPGDIVGPTGANLTIYANAGVHEFIFGNDGTFYAPDNVVLGGNSIYIGPGANTLDGIEHEVFIASSNLFPYVQAVVNNISDNGSADWVALGARGGDTGGQASLGFTSSGFGDANYTITGNGDGYVLVQSYAPGQTLLGGGGNLVLATGNQGSVKDIIFGTGGFLTANTFGRISHSNNSLELTRTGASLTFPDGSIQTTAYTGGGGGNVSELVNGNNSLVLDGDGNIVLEGTPSGNAINRGLVWDYGANANGVNSTLRQDNGGLTVRAWTENGGGANGYSAPVTITTNQDAAAKNWIFDGDGNLTVPSGSINSINDGGDLGAYITLTPDLGLARLAARDAQTSVNYTNTSWSTATYTGTQVDFTNAPDLVDFFNTNRFNDGVNQTFSINGGEPVPFTGYTIGVSNAVTVYTDVTPEPDPTTVTSIDFLYQLESYIAIDYDSSELNINATGLTINIDNDQTEGPDIVLRSGDDITLQAKDMSLGSEREGGDINLNAGDGADDDGLGNTASTGGDIILDAGRGGDGNSSSGSSGGFTTIRGGAGGSAGVTNAAGPGGYVSIVGGDGGTDGGNTSLGGVGGNVSITAGLTRQEGVNGPNVVISSGQAGPNALAGYVDIVTPASANGLGGTWRFDGNGNLTLPNNTFAVNYANGVQVSIGGGSGNTGNVTFDDVTVQGVNGLNLSAGADFTANLAYLQVRAGDVASHIHLDTGNNQAYDLIVGDDQNYVQVSSTGNILLSSYDSNTAQYTWTLDYNGNLILAGGNSVIQSIANSSLDPVNPNVSTMVLTPDPGYSTQSLVLDPTFPGHIHLRAPGANIDEPSANIFLGGETSSFEVGYHNGSAPNVFVHSGGNTWTFDNTGNLTLPGNTFAVNYANGAQVSIGGGGGNSISDGTSNVSVVATDGNVVIGVDNDVASWTFATDGNIYAKSETDLTLVVADPNGDGYAVKQSLTDGTTELSRTSLEDGQFSIYTNLDGAGEEWRFEGNTLQVSNDSTVRGFASNVTIQSMSAGGADIASLQSVSNSNDPNIFTTIDATTTGANISVYNGGSNSGVGYTWQFANDGRLTFPGTPRIDTGANNFEVQAAEAINFEANTVVNIYTDTGNTTYQWQFGDDGNLTLPDTTSVIANASITLEANSTGNITGLSVNGDADANLYAHGNVKLVSDSSNTTATWLFGDDGVLTVPGNLVYIGASPAPSISGFNSVSAEEFTNDTSNVTINANSNTWNFDSTGNLTIPSTSGGFIKTASNASIGIVAMDNGTNNPAQLLSMNVGNGSATSIVSAYSTNVAIQTNAAGAINTWSFDNNGNLTLPANTFAINYANGTQVTLGGGNISNIANGNSNVNIATANGNVTIAAVGNTTMTITGTGANITGTANISGNVIAGNLIGPLANGNSNVTIATAAGNVVTNINGSAILTTYSGGIKVGGSGILQSPGGAGAITLNNNGANIPTANITNTLNVTGAGGANITANLTAGNISTGGVVSATGNVSGNFFLGNGSQLTGITVTSLVNGTSNVVVASSGNVTVGVAGTANVITATSTGANVTGTLNATGDVTAQGTGSNIVRRAFGLVAYDTAVTLDDLTVTVSSSTSQLTLSTSGSWQGTGWTETFAGGGTPAVTNWVNLPLNPGYNNASGAMSNQGNGCRCIISDQTPSAKVYQITVVRSGTTGSQWNISIERLV